MQKTVLTRAQADALENAMTHFDKENILHNHINSLWMDERKPLHELSLERLTIALYIGYEVEKGPEEKLVDYLEQLKSMKDDSENDSRYYTGKIEGIEVALEFLGIKSKGVKFDVYA